ncbi:MAG: lamin tail domain-containing protein [Pirellulales bacterium]|nr:lamin tail domain-containing protein [Pirellulales bacterium]
MSVRFCFAAALGLWLSLVCNARAGVIISEIMFDPQLSDRDSIGADYTFNREWVELFNTGASAIDLGGWQFGDSLDNNWASPFPMGTVLGANQTLVVTGDTASFDANWGAGVNRIQVSAFPNLANSVGTNEAAAIRNNLSVLQDSVRFQEAGWPTANGSDGNSIFLLPTALTSVANDASANWRPSAHGAYGARFVNGGGQGENHGSPGLVATQAQVPFAPSPDAAWSMVILPDTQNYNKSSRDLPIFFQQANWIKDNRDLFNIQLVMQEGDFVNNNDTDTPTSGDQTGDQQWANGRQVMSILDGQVPYIIAVGNHDIGFTNADNRDTQMNTYFQPSQNPLNDPAQGGILKGLFQPGHLENAYFELNAPDGRDLLIFSLEFWPRQAVVNWAEQIASLPKYSDHTAVLLTHSYMDSDEDYWDVTPPVSGLGTDGNDGVEMWNELVKLNGNFELTFNGHIGGDGVGFKKSTGVEGNSVHQMLIDTQFETNGGNGWLRVVEFLEDGKTVRVRTYSPLLDMTRTSGAHQFQMVLSQLSMTPGDFDANGFVDSFDLATWRQYFGMAEDARRIDGDADNDGDIDGADFLTWQRNLGVNSGATAAVPEPACLGLVLLSLSGMAMLRRRAA